MNPTILNAGLVPREASRVALPSPRNLFCGLSVNQEAQWPVASRSPWMMRSVGMVQILDPILVATATKCGGENFREDISFSSVYLVGWGIIRPR